jgi:DNA replication and repair protein RecF
VVVTRLRCTDFRNYAALDVALPRGIVLILGGNGQGKTNLAEMLQFLATGKSHRTTTDRRLIRFECPLLRVEAHFERGDLGPCTIATALGRSGERKLLLNESERRRQSEVLGYLTCGLFTAQDVDLVGGEPAGRRRHLNEELAKAYPAYYDDLAAYRRALAQRNRLLKGARHSGRLPGYAAAFTSQLAHMGARVLARRAAYAREIGEPVREVYARVSEGRESLAVGYESTVDLAGCEGGRAAVEERFAAALAAAEPDEVERGSTLVGPHRDDLVFTLDGRDARRYASRGQQKTIAVALRLAEARRAGEADEPPVMVLDDIMSELDEGRRERVAEELSAFDQSLVIGTTDSDFAPSLLSAGIRFTVRAGTVTRE